MDDTQCDTQCDGANTNTAAKNIEQLLCAGEKAQAIDEMAQKVDNTMQKFSEMNDTELNYFLTHQDATFEGKTTDEFGTLFEVLPFVKYVKDYNSQENFSQKASENCLKYILHDIVGDELFEFTKGNIEKMAESLYLLMHHKIFLRDLLEDSTNYSIIYSSDNGSNDVFLDESDDDKDTRL